MKFPEHPATHGHHINVYACGSGEHRGCSGFSGGYDTYICGCCCHDGYYHPNSLTDRERAHIERLLGATEATT